MKRWRKHIICLLMLTVPLSLWAAVPDVCEQQNDTPTDTVSQQDSANSGHAHHGSDSTQPAVATPAAPQSNNAHAPIDCECCGDCLEACTLIVTTALQARQFASIPIAPTLHFALPPNSRFLGGPDYPLLYRPPIAQI